MYRDTDPSERPLLVIALVDNVIALDRRTGDIRWSTNVRTLGTSIELAVVGDRVFAVTADGHVHVIQYLDGTVMKRVKLPGSYTGRATMVVDGDHLFIASGGEITCLDRDCEVVWFNGLEGKGVGDVALGFPGNVRQADKAR